MSAGASSRPRLGLFGGSFDPIHRGHVDPIADSVRRLQLERVLYLPTANPPHKSQRRFAPALARYCMVEMALLPHPRLQVSGYELTLDRPAYTVETVEHFRARFEQAELYLFLGADSYFELEQWRRWRDLLSMVTLAILRRPGYPGEESALPRAGERAVWLDNEPVDLSSSVLRERLRQGQPVATGEVPQLVLDYSRKYQLYR